MLEETVTGAPADSLVKVRAGESYFARFLKFVCSVRLGVTLLVLLGLACLVGMLIMQENVDGFENYYAALTPAQQLVYGKLDLFDIYHSWYFSALLAVLSLNIILASIDRFPKSWAVVSKPPLTPPLRWLRDQRQTDSISVQAGDASEVVTRIEKAYRKAGWRKISISKKNGRTFVLGESGAWNRLGYLAVHVGLLTIFLGGFLTSQLGQNGQMPLMPGEISNAMLESTFELDQVKQFEKRIPFNITCTDIQQKLIKKEGPISTANTIDWLTRIRIEDGDETHEALVQMNRPFDYRGYRFFQASFTSIGRARTITIRLTPAAGGEIQDLVIPRNGSTPLPDGTQVAFSEFRGNFSIGKENLNEDTSSYPNPGAILKVTPPNTPAQTAYAFGAQMANIPVAKKPVAGYTYQLIDFEKVADRHVLSVQYDPGATVVYIGFVLLILTLIAVFFFSHKRVWAAVEETSENRFSIVIGGNANRNQTGFDDKFRRFVSDLRGPNKETSL
jgi:cytochrome c biogenesis protein